MQCSRPKLIYNKYLGHNVFVPCLECDNCKIAKSNKLFISIQNECDRHPYNVYFTLTYDNEHIPYVDILDPTHIKRYGEVIDDIDLTSKYINKLWNTPKNVYKVVNKILIPDERFYRFRAVFLKKDIQDFLKRVRRNLYYFFTKDLNLNNYDDETRKSVIEKINEFIKLRYVVVSENGTKHHRPHYHGIFHCKNREVGEWLLKNIPACWQFCDWSSVAKRNFHGRSGLPSFVEKSCSSYVSSYISCDDYSFPLSQTDKFRPFQMYSRKPIYGLSSLDEDIAKKIVTGLDYTFVKTKSLSNGNTFDVKCSNKVGQYLFGRFQGIDKLSVENICQIILRPCAYSPRPVRNFVTKVGRLIKKFYGVVNSATVFDYVTKVRNFLTRFASFRLYTEQLSKYSSSNPLSYVKQCYQTFSPYIDTSAYNSTCDLPLATSVLRFCLSSGLDSIPYESLLDVMRNPFEIFRPKLNQIVQKYKNRLMPKHSHTLNYNYYATI